MLKARFIDKILEALRDEARKIKIFGNTFLTYFYEIESKDKYIQEKRLTEEREILDVLMQLKFQDASLSLENVKVFPVFITTYNGKDGIVVKQLKPDWISSLPKAEKNYYNKRLELMQSYLPKD